MSDLPAAYWPCSPLALYRGGALAVPVSRMTKLRFLLLAFVGLAVALPLVPAAQAASASGVAAQRQWALMDKCAKQAIQKFPDHTAADLAKRDEFIRLCQRNQHVPVRQGLAPK